MKTNPCGGRHLQILHYAGIGLHYFQTLSGIVWSTGPQYSWENGLLVEELAHHVVIILEKPPEANHLLGVIVRYFLIDQGSDLKFRK